MIAKDIIAKSFWALKTSEVLDLLETTNEGLTEEEVKERLKIFGKNEISEKKRITRLKIFLNQLKSPLIFLLFIAAIITFLLKDYGDAIAIFLAALINSLLGFYQENKAEEVLAHLKSYIEERVRVIREGHETEIDAKELVPGDIIRVSQGDRVPADCRLIYLNDLMADEAILTGESLPVDKSTEPTGFQAALGDQKSMIFSGTLIVQGFGNAAVCRTNENTEIGRIAVLVKSQKQEKTPLQKAIQNFSLKASAILLILTALVFLAGIFSGVSPLEMFLTAVAILVSAIPEGLPVAMTVILAIGVQRLAKKKGIIRKLLAAETLGNTTIILTDKTGTLTQAKMELSRILTFTEAVNDDLAIKLAMVNSDVIIENPKAPRDKWRIIGRPLEIALVKAGAKIGILPQQAKKEIRSIDYLPFNSSNKFSASLNEYQGKKLICLFGAPEILLKLSSQTPETERQYISKEIDKMAYNGERVLGLALKEAAGDKEIRLHAKVKFENFRFIATISFTDPIRPGVRDTIHRIEQVGIKTVIVTGDHRGTAEAIAKELGFPINPNSVINGAELDSLTEEDLIARLPQLRLVSRVSPEGKLKIAKAFQETGEIVAMTGDGINDAPSLKQADIGVAMGSGTDVAKDVAELVLLDNNFETIVAAIEEGRRTMENIRKVLVYFFSSLLDELILIGSSLVFGIPLPLSAAQILWINLITDSFPAVALAFENGIDHLLSRAPRPSKKLFDRKMQLLIFATGIPTSFLLFGIYYWLLQNGTELALAQTFTFATLGCYSLFLIFSIRSLQKSIFAYPLFSNPYVAAGSGAGFLLMLTAVYLPFFQNLFGTVPLLPVWLAGVILIGLFNIAAIEIAKYVINRTIK